MRNWNEVFDMFYTVDIVKRSVTFAAPRNVHLWTVRAYTCVNDRNITHLHESHYRAFTDAMPNTESTCAFQRVYQQLTFTAISSAKFGINKTMFFSVLSGDAVVVLPSTTAHEFLTPIMGCFVQHHTKSSSVPSEIINCLISVSLFGKCR